MTLDRRILFRLATNQAVERCARAVPPIRRSAWRAASRYVAGPEVDDAVRVVDRLAASGVAASIDQFGEQVSDLPVARGVGAAYLRLAERLSSLPGDAWLSVDLSHLGIDVDPGGCADDLADIAEALPAGRRVQVGAEDEARSEPVLEAVLDVARRGFADRLGATVQANLLRAPRDLDRLVEAGVHIRLVKGAYLESADRALPHGEPTDLAFVRLAHRLASSGTPFALATHDGVIREALLAALGPVPVEQLLGVRGEVASELVSRGVPVRVYVPFGEDWFRYWMRRVAESRGAPSTRAVGLAG